MWLLLAMACHSEPEDTGGIEVPEDLSACFIDASCPYAVGMAHRGAAFQAPENTIAALDAAVDSGAHGVEVDVRTTADGVLVLMHDGTVDRTTDGTGEVSALTLAQVQALVVPSDFEGVPDQRVPTFLEALEHLAPTPMVVDVDVKGATAEDMAADIRAAGMEDRVFLLTKSVSAGESYRAVCPEIAIMPNVDHPQDLLDYLHLEPELVEVDFIEVDEAGPLAAEHGVRLFTQTLGFEAAWIDQGVQAEAWGELLDQGVGVLLTDRPEELAPVLEARNLSAE